MVQNDNTDYYGVNFIKHFSFTSKYLVNTPVSRLRWSRLRCCAVLQKHVIPALKNRTCLNTTIFMLDCYLQHIASPLKLFRQAFVKKPWPYYKHKRWNFLVFLVSRLESLWILVVVTIKDCVYKEKFSQLKANIIKHVQNIQPETLNATVDHTVLCLQQLIGLGGWYMEHIRIFGILL